MSKVAFARESAHAVWDEIQPLLAEHWREIAHFDDIPLEPRREVYEHLETIGGLYVFTVRDDGHLVGYAVYVVDVHMHYASSKQATQDVLFLLPGYRNAGIGMGLINYADTAMRDAGVQVVLQHVKLAHDFGPLLKALDYEQVESIYARRLDR